MTSSSDDERRARWRALASAEIGGADPASLERRSAAGLQIRPLYDAADLAGLDSLGSLPGEYPFVRGARATMYAGRPWTLRQYAGFSTPEATNAFFRRALAAGQRGLSVAFDLPTHRGYDSDEPHVAGDVGKAGVAVDTVEDLKLIFAEIPLAQISVSMTMNGAVLPVLAGFIVAAEEQGVSLEQLSGTIQNDILKEFMVRNTYIYPPAPSLRIVADVMQYVSERMPRFNSISISGYHLQEAGASAELELAYTLADGLEYLQVARERGLDLDSVGRGLSFFFGIGPEFFTEICKLRAARGLWAMLVRERFAPKDPRTLMLRMHCQTSGVSLTAQDPLNNVVRTTIEALAAVLGGTQSLHTNAYDEALALPSERSARIARNTQLILQHETDVTRVADPLGGSYFVERTTSELMASARAVIEEIDQIGGMARAIELGIPQRRIERAAAERQVRVDRGSDVIVGVNKFRAPDEPELELFAVETSAVLGAQIARLERVRSARDQARVAQALAALEQGARRDQNLLELAIEAMRARATVGEVSHTLARVFGRYEASNMAATGVFTEAYGDEQEWLKLVDSVQRFARDHGRRPRLLLAKLGQDGHDRGVKVVAAGLSDLGFDVDLGPLFQTPDDVARQALESDVHFVGVSTQAGAHLTLVPELVQALARLGASGVQVVVGGIVPARDHDALFAAGVRAVFGPGTKVTDIARDLLGLASAAASGGTQVP
ncbi:MAG TPA: methylmalonyl-CoA mutase [Polyangiaceae bacterium]|nr:methylmalonyl-CoA mutase [Polyangiaceae bacterium]